MYFDVVMPLTLFSVVTAALFLSGKVEKRLKGSLEERQFGVRDAVLLVVTMSVAVSLIVFIPQLAVMIVFLFAYSMLLFLFTYVFSDFQKTWAQLFSLGFFGASAVAGTLSLSYASSDSTFVYGAAAFYALAVFAVAALFFDQRKKSSGERWYLAVMPPALFILMYAFFGRTPLWFPYLMNVYGVIFAVFIVLYLGTLFTWKTSLVFVAFITVMDTILVLFTGTMVSAAQHVSALMLPVLIMLPTIPTIFLEGGAVLYMGLGLGDFFFAGLLAVQTFKKFDRKTAILSVVAMVISFFIFEVIMLNYRLTAFPGTVMILGGWAVVALAKTVANRMSDSKRNVSSQSGQVSVD